MSDYPIVVLIAGNGSNLQALIDQPDKHYHIAAVISHRPDAYGLERAQRAHIPCHVIDHKHFANRHDFDHALMQQIDHYHPKLVVLAGFMRQLGSTFVNHYAGHLINIHPSLLPKYPGLHTHQRALTAGDANHGVSVHFVTSDLDAGPMIAQASLPIETGDDADSLKTRVQFIEHQLYPYVVNLFAKGRLSLQDDGVLRDGKSLPKSGFAWPDLHES